VLLVFGHQPTFSVFKPDKDYPMKNITLSADESLIRAARERAQSENTTLNEQFRRWLETYVQRDRRAQVAMDTIADLQTRLSTKGRQFTRDEMNER